jgi:hypothetical protein
VLRGFPPGQIHGVGCTSSWVADCTVNSPRNAPAREMVALECRPGADTFISSRGSAGIHRRVDPRHIYPHNTWNGRRGWITTPCACIRERIIPLRRPAGAKSHQVGRVSVEIFRRNTGPAPFEWREARAPVSAAAQRRRLKKPAVPSRKDAPGVCRGAGTNSRSLKTSPVPAQPTFCLRPLGASPRSSHRGQGGAPWPLRDVAVRSIGHHGRQSG